MVSSVKLQGSSDAQTKLSLRKTATRVGEEEKKEEKAQRKAAASEFTPPNVVPEVLQDNK
ncbi:hypothetical protein [Comamonas testosteroni]|uniref:hypothetical protein n=1 Tax=Comamonas testosteroni TaxID=285 RepID=UPI000311A8CD|nr:hypothetical protein [Comamonas testosteroni]